MKQIHQRLWIASIAIVSAFSILTSVAFAEVQLTVVPGRSSVEFNVKHFLLSNVKGKFRRYSGRVSAQRVGDFSGASVEASIPVESIYTGNADRDNHLLQEVFFDAERYPVMKFKSTKVVKVDDDQYQMDGTLSIRDTSHPITFMVEASGKTVLGNGKSCWLFRANSSLDRYEYGLKWNELTETGAIAVGQNVDIVMNIALVEG